MDCEKCGSRRSVGGIKTGYRANLQVRLELDLISVCSFELTVLRNVGYEWLHRVEGVYMSCGLSGVYFYSLTYFC